MKIKVIPLLFTLIFMFGCSVNNAPSTLINAQQQVFAAERAFAASMRDRDFAAFKTFVDDEAIFFNGPEAFKGKEQVFSLWSKYFNGANAPFSWEPDQVEVLASGRLALSTGYVFIDNGVKVARFNSIWRSNGKGDWKVIFDKGSPLETAKNTSENNKPEN